MAANDRLHALDTVRALALLLGIVLHATMSFFLPIPALDSSQSTTLAVAFYVIHIFRMSLFFLLAGLFARMLLERRGVRAFTRDRVKRIVAPLLGGWVVLAPLTIGAIIWGVSRQSTDLEALGAAPGAPASGFPLIHLWFLYYLSLFYLLALGLRSLLEARPDRAGRLRASIDRPLRALLSTPVAPFVIAAPLLGTLYWLETPLWTGIPTPDVGLVPKIPAMVGFGTAFGLGWLLHGRTDLLAAFEKRWALNLVLAGVLSAACLWLVGTPNAMEPVTLDPWSRLGYLAGYTAAIWYWSFGLIGAALRFCSEASPWRRYLADSSYWLYLLHLPVVFFLQVLVADLPWHWTVKFPMILGSAMALLLTSYHYLVRPTFIGEILNGRRYPRRGGSPDPAPRGPGGPRGALPGSTVAELGNVTKRYSTTTALAGVDLAVERGELLAVLGPNGAGKSTAISLWLGMFEPDDGTVALMGRSPLDAASRLEVGVMLQEVDLAPELRVHELIELTASYYANPLSADEVMTLTNTTALARKQYGKLSSGQKRQIQFAAAICGRPRLLFLDEPTVGLDVQARHAMWKCIRELVGRGCAIVLTTHYLEEAEALADRVAVLAEGRLIALGSVAEMRSLVSRKQISCTSSAKPEDIRLWPGVVEAVRTTDTLRITALDAENVVRRLLAADEDLHDLEVRQASLAEAFTELTEEAA